MTAIIRSIVIFLLTISYTLTGLSQTYSSNDPSKSPQSVFWPSGKKMALSLTFDDARFSQIDTGIPLLDKYGVKATFYISPGSMLQRADGWKSAVMNGHEIGNHSLYHPCSGNFTWSRNKPWRITRWRK